MCRSMYLSKVMLSTEILKETDLVDLDTIDDPFKGFEYLPNGILCPDHQRTCEQNQTCCRIPDRECLP